MLKPSSMAVLAAALAPLLSASTATPEPAPRTRSGGVPMWMLRHAVRGVFDRLAQVPVASNPLRQVNLYGNLAGTWSTGSDLPTALGEVAGAVVNGRLHLFGEGNSGTFVYHIDSNTWFTGAATRPFPGNHHACERVGGKLYLFGGLGGGAGRVQIYSPALNQWTVGANMPWSGGSCVSGRIGGKVYVGGGIVGNSTVSNLSVYDPVNDTWDANGPLAPMPVGVNHAAAATDGIKLYVFGGRQGGNFPQPGFDTVQVYDPQTNTWDSSSLPGSSLAPMPLGRGGTGRAVYYFGVFLVMGGESSNQVFDDVQVYDPVANSWRTDTDMPTARHGIFPILHRYRVFLAGGGTSAGFSASRLLEIYRHP